jgi:hypothetical protein
MSCMRREGDMKHVYCLNLRKYTKLERGTPVKTKANIWQIIRKLRIIGH